MSIGTFLRKMGPGHWNYTDGAANVIQINPSSFDISWAGAGTTNAPATSNYWIGAIGVNNDGAASANVYWIVEISGVFTWVDTGKTVTTL